MRKNKGIEAGDEKSGAQPVSERNRRPCWRGLALASRSRSGKEAPKVLFRDRRRKN